MKSHKKVDPNLIEVISEYNYLSPDGITISSNNFKTIPTARKGLKNWIKQYKKQGYYSSIRGRISLEDLKNNCIFISC